MIKVKKAIVLWLRSCFPISVFLGQKIIVRSITQILWSGLDCISNLVVTGVGSSRWSSIALRLWYRWCGSCYRPARNKHLIYVELELFLLFFLFFIPSILLARFFFPSLSRSSISYSYSLGFLSIAVSLTFNLFFVCSHSLSSFPPSIFSLSLFPYIYFSLPNSLSFLLTISASFSLSFFLSSTLSFFLFPRSS